MRLGYVILYVSDVEKTVSFYERAFGLTRGFVHESGYGELVTGDTKLAFAQFELAGSHGFEFQKPGRSSLAHASEIALIAEDVTKAFDVAVAAGALTVSKPEHKPWGQWVAYVRDLDGHTVEICSAMG